MQGRAKEVAPTASGRRMIMDKYIEREAAYEDFEKCNSENPKWTPSRVKALIARQKAADVATVRHGRWIGCNGEIVDWDETHGLTFFRFDDAKELVIPKENIQSAKLYVD